MQNLIFPSPTLAPYLQENQQPVAMVKPGANTYYGSHQSLAAKLFFFGLLWTWSSMNTSLGEFAGTN